MHLCLLPGYLRGSHPSAQEKAGGFGSAQRSILSARAGVELPPLLASHAVGARQGSPTPMAVTLRAVSPLP